MYIWVTIKMSKFKKLEIFDILNYGVFKKIIFFEILRVIYMGYIKFDQFRCMRVKCDLLIKLYNLYC